MSTLATTTSYTVVDLDDFCDENNGLDMLYRLKEAIPTFKVNLFTIPMKCTPQFIRRIQAMDWIDMIPHGWSHYNSRECENWSRTTCDLYLKHIERYGFTRGFKAPGWQISTPMYDALLDSGYWVADQAYNNHRRPPELRTYLLDAPYKVHGHIGHLGGHNANALELIYDDLSKLQGEFKFIKEIL